MRVCPPVFPVCGFSILAIASLLSGVVASSGCGASAPHVDPRPLSEGGIPDRVLFEVSAAGDSNDGGAGGLDGAGDVGDAGDPGDDDGGAGDTAVDIAASDGAVLEIGSGGDGGAVDGAAPIDGSSDASMLPTTVTVDVTDPLEDALQVAALRFTPLISVLVTTDPAGSDDIKQVDVEVWSTSAMPAKISSTRLAQLSKTSPGTAGADAGVVVAVAGDAGAGNNAGASDAASQDGGVSSGTIPQPSIQTLFTFGDTPVDLSSVATDAYELRVTATTLAGVTASTKRKLRVDAGPVIKVISPTVDQAARGSMFVSVQVTDPYSATPPTVSVGVANIAITPLTVVGDLYQASVGETIAMPPLSGEQLLDVGAVNAAGVAARHVVVKFVFDDIGPVITNGKPATGSLIGGIAKLEADITDPAGVDVNTVVAVVAHGDASLEVKLDQDPNDHKHFSHLFDTRRLSNTVLYPTISFRASDLPGNQSNIGYTVAVDNTPPLADLDPPADLRMRRDVNGIWRCSWQFDPLGTDAVNDGDYVLQLFDVRARVEDEGNSPVAGGADITPLAGLDPAHVELLVLDNTNRALVVDTDGDGVCDAVNPMLAPTTTPMSSLDALLVNLAPVPPTGGADFTPDATILSAGFGDCTMGNDTLKPIGLCKTSDMTVAIPSHQTTEAAVWTIPKVVPASVQCVGNQLDVLGNHINDGPACLAIHAIDQLANAQVSRVIHVCIDHDGNGAECPFAPIASVQGGSPVRIDTIAPHGLATGARALVGAIPTLFDANGLWKVTVVSDTAFTLDGSNTPAVAVSGGQFMRWTAASDCTGRQTAISPAVVDDTIPCRPWRRFSRGEHLDTD